VSILKKRRNRIIAAIVAAALLISALVVGFATTLAREPDKTVRLKQPNTHNVLPHGGSPFTFSTGGLSTARVMDPSFGTFSIVGTNYSFNRNGEKRAGVAQIVRVTNAAVFMQDLNFQIVDPNAITGYNLPNGGNGFVNGTSTTPINLGIRYFRTAAPVVPANPPWAPNEANLDANESNYEGTPAIQTALAAQVTWTSLDNTILEVVGTTPGSQQIFARRVGMTLLLGEFTDRWGVTQYIHYLFGVGVEPGREDTSLSRLLDAVSKGDTINGLTPNPYRDLTALQAALAAARTLLAGDPTNAQMDTARTAIETAIGALRPATGAIIERGDYRYIKTTFTHEGNDLYLRLNPQGEAIYPGWFRLDGSDNMIPYTVGTCALCETRRLRILELEGQIKALENLLGVNNWADLLARIAYLEGLEGQVDALLAAIAEMKDINATTLAQLRTEIERLLAENKTLREQLAQACKSEFCGVAHIRPDGTNYYVRTGALHNGYHIYLQLEAAPADGPRNVRHPFVYAIFNPGRTVVYPTEDGGWTTTGSAPLLPNSSDFQNVNITLTEGYSAHSQAFAITGIPAPTVARTAGNPAINWSGGNITVAAGLTGSTTAAFNVTNGVGTATFIVNVTVNPAGPDPRPATSFTTSPAWGDITMTVGNETEAYTFTLTPSNSTSVMKLEAVSGGSFISISADNRITAVAPGTATVRAVTQAGAQVGSTFTVTVNPPVIPPVDGGNTPVAGRRLTAAQAGDGSDWIEIARNGGYSLILRTDSLPSPHSIFNPNGGGNNYIGSTAQTNLNAWWGTMAGTSIGQHAVNHNALSRRGTWANLNAANGFSIPSGSDSGAFLLSFQEAANYMSRSWWNGSTSIVHPVGSIPRTNWVALGREGTYVLWWLRSPGSEARQASSLGANGNVSEDAVNAFRELLPALWVETARFTWTVG